MNIVRNDSQAPASSSSHWETKALIVASVVVLAASVFFAYHFQGHNPPLFYASCGGGGLSITVLTIFAIRSCRACGTQKKVRKSITPDIFTNVHPIIPSDDPAKVMRGDQIINNVPNVVPSLPHPDVADEPVEPQRSVNVAPLPQPIVNVAPVNDQKAEDRDSNLISSIIAPPPPLPPQNDRQNPPPPHLNVEQRDARLPERLQRLDSLKQIENPLRRKHRISRLENINSKNIGAQGKPKSGWRGYLLKPFSAVGKYLSAAVDYLLGGGHLQQRAYYHLLSSLLDPITSFLGDQVRQVPIIEKVNQIVDTLKSKHGARFNFLIDEEACNGDLQTNLHLMFMKLIQVANPNQNFATIRYNFFQYLDAAWESKEYKEKIIHFRKLQKDEAIKKYPEIAFMQMLGFAIFTQMHFGKYADESVFSVFKKGNNQHGEHPEEGTSFPDIIKEDHASIDRVDKAFLGGYLFEAVNRAQGTANVFFSPLEKNNFASVYWRSLFQVGEKSLTSTCLRFGTPTTESFNNPTILPAMYLFLDYCKREGLKVVSMQHQNPKTKWGDESKRLQKMFDLAKEYEGTFFVFGLPMDGPFFKQNGKYGDELADAMLFKNEFFAHLTGKRNDSLIQLSLNNLKKQFPNAEKEINDILNYVHDNFFQSCSKMTIDERQIFQLITYSYLVEYFSLGLEANFHHCQCKDAQDRAVVLLTTLNQISAIRLEKEKDPQEIRKSRALIEFACLMIKGMSLHEHRFPLLEKIVQHLSSLTDVQKESIRKNPIKINGKPSVLKEMITEDVPNQSLYRVPSEALSMEEYHQLLNEEIARGTGFEFVLNFFVQNFFDVPKQEAYIDGLYNQFRKKDVPRQHYMIDGQKLHLALFRNKLSLMTNKAIFAKEFKNDADKDAIVNAIVLLEQKTVDPLKFCTVVHEMNTSATFKKEVLELYHDLRAEAVQRLLNTWTQNDGPATKKLLAMSQQGLLFDVTAALEQRYRFIQDGPSLDPEREPAPIDSKKTIQVFQRDPKGTANTCFNYLTKNGRRIIEAYQLYEITQGDDKQTLYYMVTKTRVDLETGHAHVISLPPRKERPEDISKLVAEMNRSTDSLVDSFIEVAI